MSAIDGIHAQLLTPLRLDVAADLARLLDVLEDDPELAPTHWGEIRGVRDPYDRAKLLARVEVTRERLVPELRGARPVRWSAHWYVASDGTLSAVQLDAAAARDAMEARAFFDAVSRLAGRLPLELGSVDVRFVDQPKGTTLKRGSSVHHLDSYTRVGPQHVFARNYVGRRLLSLIGEGSVEGGARTIEEAEGVTRTLPNGVMELDLVESPWAADAVALKAAQRVVEARLRSTAHILAHETAKLRDVPGLRWVSPSGVPQP